MDLQAVVFDMDGVLTATVEYHYRSWKKVADQLGIPFDRKKNERLLGLTRRSSLEVILAGRKLPEDEKEEILRKKNEHFLKSVADMGPEDILPGVARLLRQIDAAGVPMAVASASRNTAPVLESLDIAGYFTAIVDGNQVQRSKPAPDVYLQAAEALSFDPAECLAIEDSQAGAQAALAAGMCVVGVGPASHLPGLAAAFPDLSGVNWQDLQEIYRRWSTSQPPSLFDPPAARNDPTWREPGSMG